ncbi:MAG: cryptochrome/photolyase family protein [Candidatus Dojkabacteria bacterium]
MKIGLIFPHQLFEQNPIFEMDLDRIYLIKDSLFYGDKHTELKFHPKKIALHEESIEKYIEKYKPKIYKLIDYDKNKTIRDFVRDLPKSVVEIITLDPIDYLLEKRLKEESEKQKIKLTYFDSPMFLNSRQDLEDYKTKIEEHKKDTYFFSNFYIYQRKRLGILIDENGKPEAGKWSFDPENRKKFPKEIKIPKTEIKFATTHRAAKNQLNKFLEERLANFGDYEDAFSANVSVGFHSLLTPALNIGLITPKEVVEETLRYSKKHEIPLNSLEGFIRQIIGWREFMRFIYLEKGSDMRTSNFFKHKKELDSSWYEGKTGAAPVDDCISKVQENAYLHHIERLMVMGNFMLLSELDPKQVYKWFMELFIDAYDWVMVPNVYGMSQYADGGSMVTKPYISSSNYIRKMSDYKKEDWCELWDKMYWDFLENHRNKLEKNPRMSMMYNILDKRMDNKK